MKLFNLFDWLVPALGNYFTFNMGGGGSAPSAPTTQTVNQVSIPPEIMPYATSTLAAAKNQLFSTDAAGNITGMQPYVPYSTNPADYVAGFSPLQQQAQQGVAGLQLPGEFGAAS